MKRVLSLIYITILIFALSVANNNALASDNVVKVSSEYLFVASSNGIKKVPDTITAYKGEKIRGVPNSHTSKGSTEKLKGFEDLPLLVPLKEGAVLSLSGDSTFNDLPLLVPLTNKGEKSSANYETFKDLPLLVPLKG